MYTVEDFFWRFLPESRKTLEVFRKTGPVLTGGLNVKFVGVIYQGGKCFHELTGEEVPLGWVMWLTNIGCCAGDKDSTIPRWVITDKGHFALDNMENLLSNLSS